MLKDRGIGYGDGVATPLAGSRLALLAALGTLAQLTQGVVGLALVLVGHRAGFAVSTSAAAVAAFMVAVAVGRPVQGRALDRFGARLVLGGCGIAHLAAYVGIAVAADHRSAPAFVLGAAAAGLTLPPIATRQRASWPLRVRRGGALGAFALISSLQTVALLVAPALFTVVAVASSARAGMLAVAGLAALCTLACAVLDDGGRQHGSITRVAVRRYVAPLAGTGAVGLVAGSVEVVAPVLAIAAHHPTAGGPLVLAEAFGTFAGAVVASRSSRSLLGAGLALQAAGCAAVTIPAPLVVVGCELFVVGVGLPPALATLSMRVSHGSGGTAESFGWQSTALAIGTAAGSALSGLLTHAVGAHAASLPAVGGAVLGLVLVRRLTARAAPGP